MELIQPSNIIAMQPRIICRERDTVLSFPAETSLALTLRNACLMAMGSGAMEPADTQTKPALLCRNEDNCSASKYTSSANGG